MLIEALESNSTSSVYREAWKNIRYLGSVAIPEFSITKPAGYDHRLRPVYQIFGAHGKKAAVFVLVLFAVFVAVGLEADDKIIAVTDDVSWGWNSSGFCPSGSGATYRISRAGRYGRIRPDKAMDLLLYCPRR